MSNNFEIFKNIVVFCKKNILKSNLIIFNLFFLFIFLSCEKEPETKKEIPSLNEGGIFILNEGNFMWENASLSFYDKNKKELFNHVFTNVNNKKLGDVAQSMFIKDSIGFIVMNNSFKIEMINIYNFKNIGTISGFKSPRYITFINKNKAYVSDLHDKNIKIINPTEKKIIGEIEIGKSTEEMILYNDLVFVCNWLGGKTISVIDTKKDKLIHQIPVGREPNSIILDKNNKIWVLCSGGFENNSAPTLNKINPETFIVEKTFNFYNENTSPKHLKINANKDSLFFVDKGVYTMSISDENLPTKILIPNETKVFYNLHINKESDIFVSYPIDYVQNAYVFQFNNKGVAKDTFKVNIIPSFMLSF